MRNHDNIVLLPKYFIILFNIIVSEICNSKLFMTVSNTYLFMKLVNCIAKFQEHVKFHSEIDFIFIQQLQHYIEQHFLDFLIGQCNIFYIYTIEYI